MVACKSHKSVTTSTHTKDDKKNTSPKNTSLKKKYAEILGVSESDIKNEKLYQFINEWYGTPYKYGGKDKHGIDCSAFAGKVLGSVYGVSLPRTAADQYKMSERISRENLVEGDLVFFNTRGGVSHAGVYLGNNYFVFLFDIKSNDRCFSEFGSQFWRHYILEMRFDFSIVTKVFKVKLRRLKNMLPIDWFIP